MKTVGGAEKFTANAKVRRGRSAAVGNNLAKWMALLLGQSFQQLAGNTMGEKAELTGQDPVKHV